MYKLFAACTLLITALVSCVPTASTLVEPPTDFPLKDGVSWSISYTGIPSIGAKTVKVNKDFQLDSNVYRVSLEAQNLNGSDRPVKSTSASYASSPRTFRGFSYNLLVTVEFSTSAERGDLLMCYLALNQSGNWEGNSYLLLYRSGNQYANDASGTCSLKKQ